MLMRHHSALHILDAVVEKEYHQGITGGQIYTDRARLDFAIPSLTKEMVQDLIDKTQEIVDRGVPINAKILTQAEALAIPGLARTQPGEELLRRLSSVRVVEIEGIDRQMDGGLHVANSKEVGKIKFNSYENKGSARKRVEISVSD
jgi:misacylated tRNA(Ala) deacylase